MEILERIHVAAREVHDSAMGLRGSTGEVPDDPEGIPGAKLIKNVERYTLLKGSTKKSGEAKVRFAFTLPRVEGYGTWALSDLHTVQRF